MPAALIGVALACVWGVVQYLTPAILAAMVRRAMRESATDEDAGTHESGPPPE